MSPKLPVITSKKLLKALQRAGFVIDRQRGSHISMYHPDKPEFIVVIPFHNVDLKKGMLKRILKDADMEIEDLIELL